MQRLCRMRNAAREEILAPNQLPASPVNDGDKTDAVGEPRKLLKELSIRRFELD